MLKDSELKISYTAVLKDSEGFDSGDPVKVAQTIGALSVKLLYILHAKSLNAYITC